MSIASPAQINFIKKLEARIGIEGPEPCDSLEASTRIEELLATVPAPEVATRLMWRLARDHGGIFQPLIGKRLPWGKTSTVIDTMNDRRPTQAMLDRLNEIRAQLELAAVEMLPTTKRLYEQEKEMRARIRDAGTLDILADLPTDDEAGEPAHTGTAYTDEDSVPESEGSSVRTTGRRRS